MNKQKVSHHSLSAQNLKEIPGSMGDPLNALTILPGVERTFGLVGDMVIRGVNPRFNRYYIDGMPLNYVMHFNSENSVIAAQFIENIDLYSSSFPAKYGNALGSVLEINTIDSVNEFQGIVDMNMLSLSVFFKGPIAIRKDTEESANKNTGYFIFGGRSNGFKYLLENTKDFTDYSYEKYYLSNYQLKYWDYQFKATYNLSKQHSFTLLGVGSGDKQYRSFDIIEEKREMFHNQGIYYTFATDRFKNRLLAYSSWSKRYLYRRESMIAIFMMSSFNNTPGGLELPYETSRNSWPYILGLKNHFEYKWLDKYCNLKGEIEYTYHSFEYNGKGNLEYNMAKVGEDTDTRFVYEPVDLQFNNRSVGGYLENQFKYKGFHFSPGVRIDYLRLGKTTIVDPRAQIYYKFISNTTISAGGGKYSSFIQVNPSSLFNDDPRYAAAHYAEPERATHYAASVEQLLAPFVLSVEGFYNSFHNLFKSYPTHDSRGALRIGLNRGEMKVHGAEIMIRKDRDEEGNGFFGWISYAYIQSKEKSGLLLPFDMVDTFTPVSVAQESDNNAEIMSDLIIRMSTGIYDPDGNRWKNNKYERVHSGKAVLGYTYNAHTFSSRFQYHTSIPYTNVIGDSNSIQGTSNRFPYPVYNPIKYTEHYSNNHRLDLRYSYKKNYSWGHANFYLGIIDVYAPFIHHVNRYEYIMFFPYNPGTNPEPLELRENEGGFRILGGIVPTFGVEIKL